MILDNKICLNCLKAYEPKRSTSKFCSDLCRKQYSRRETEAPKISVTEELSGTENAKVSVTPKINFKEYNAQDLYTAINAYPHDTWIGSPEFKELERRLKTMSVEELKERGYFIPARML